MAPRFYVINIDGRFVGDRFFTETPREGDIFFVAGEPVEIVEVRRSIGVVLAEIVQDVKNFFAGFKNFS